MKKFLLAVLPMFLYGCCALSQIPPQVVYVDQNCQAALPDYRLSVVASDNCGDVTLMQFPEPGTILGADTPALDVTIQGVDRFGLITEITVPVTLIDTIPPILEWVQGVAQLSSEDVTQAYRNWEQMVKYHGIAEWIYNRQWVPDTLILPPEVEQSLWYFSNTIALDSTEYAEYLTYINH
jgi:hypothetical protein